MRWREASCTHGGPSTHCSLTLPLSPSYPLLSLLPPLPAIIQEAPRSLEGHTHSWRCCSNVQSQEEGWEGLRVEAAVQGPALILVWSYPLCPPSLRVPAPPPPAPAAVRGQEEGDVSSYSALDPMVPALG